MMQPQWAEACEDKVSPVLFMQEYANDLNDIILVVWACHYTIHKVPSL